MAKKPWDHFAKRAVEERQAAARAALPEIAATHLQLSKYYAEIAERHGAGAPADGSLNEEKDRSD